MSDPRLRTWLRQAHKNVENGKRTAALELYRQILQEAPDTADAWAGLGNALTDPQERETAYERALTLDPHNQLAQLGMAKLHNRPLPNQPAPPEKDEAEEHPALTPLPTNQSLTCYRHPDKETSLRCNRCGQPICMKCAQRTSVGYRCPDCIRVIEDGYFTAEKSDYVIAAVVSIFLSLIIGVGLLFVTFLNFFLYILIFLVGSVGGTLVARITSYAIGRRRGRYIPHLVTAAVALGAILPSLCISGLLLIGLLLGDSGLFSFAALGPIIGPLLYAGVAGSAAFYWLK